MTTQQIRRIDTEGVAAPTVADGKWDYRTNAVSYDRATYVSPTTDNGDFGDSARSVARQVDKRHDALVPTL